VHGLSSEQVYIYAICWLVAFCASISRSARDADSVTLLRMLGLGSSSGFLSVGFVGIWWSDPAASSPMYFLGASAVIGLMSREQEKITKMFFDRIWRLFGEKGEQ
jgi:hypothetical protein